MEAAPCAAGLCSEAFLRFVRSHFHFSRKGKTKGLLMLPLLIKMAFTVRATLCAYGHCHVAFTVSLQLGNTHGVKHIMHNV